MERRIDRADVLTSPRKIPGGGWVYPGIIAHPGIYKYRRADGSFRRELVLPEDLHNADTLASLERAPVTVEHVPGDVVDLHNADSVVVGDVANTRAQSRGTYGEIAVRTAPGLAYIAKVRREKGKVGVSPVYEMPRYDATPGYHPEYGEYDARQGPRVYNSVAIVANPRGENAHLRLDSEDAVIEEGPVDPKNTENPPSEEGQKPPASEGQKPPAEGEMPEKDDPTSEEEVPADAKAPAAPAAPAAQAVPTLSPEMLLLKEAIIAELRGFYMAQMDGMSKMVMDACRPAIDGFGAHAQALGGYVGRFDSMFGRRADSADGKSPEATYFHERKRLEGMADAIGLPENLRSDDLGVLKRNLVKVVRPNVNADASDAYIDGILDGADWSKGQPTARAPERRADSAPQVPALDVDAYIRSLTGSAS